MSNKTKGNFFVVGQFILLAIVVFSPKADAWQVGPWVAAISSIFLLLGILLLGLSFANLGRSLTANPVPLERAQLKTKGAYSIVRHPIYLSLLLMALSSCLQSQSIATLLAYCSLAVLLNLKARFEEKLLLEKYETYRAYAAEVGRLLPGIGRLGQS